MNQPRYLLPPALRASSALSAGDWVPHVRASRGRRQQRYTDKSGITYRKANLHAARPFQWAWEQRILLGYINLLVGIEGVGKGNLVAWVLARITQGDLPGDLHGQQRSVALVGDEDSFENIWVPRLHEASADLSQVVYLESGPSGVIDVHKDAEALGEYVTANGIAALYFDQLFDNLGMADSWKDQHVRNALAPLRAMVQETNLALLATLHPNKSNGTFRQRISGTPAFNAVSRSSLLVTHHPTDPARRVAVRAKGNYSAEPPAFEFGIEERAFDVGRGNGKRTIITSRICDISESGLKAEDVLDSRNGRRGRADSQVGAARRLLAELFADGQERPATEVLRMMSEQYGLNARTVQQATTDLKLQKRQDGFQGPWYWKPAGRRRGAV
jgi:hypothetical protein